MNANSVTVAAGRVACAALVVGVILALLAFIVYMTFVPSLPTEPGFTLAHWANLLSPRFLTVVLPNTAIVGFGTIAVGSFFALPLAWLLNRTSLPLRNTLITLMALVAAGMVWSFKRRGWFGHLGRIDGEKRPGGRPPEMGAGKPEQ